jgi:hypothetical protein
MGWRKGDIGYAWCWYMYGGGRQTSNPGAIWPYYTCAGDVRKEIRWRRGSNLCRCGMGGCFGDKICLMSVTSIDLRRRSMLGGGG